MNGPAQQVSFRLAGQFVNELKRRADESGVSPGAYAKKTLINTLESDPALETRNRVAELQDELQLLRQELWTSVAMLLTNAGKTEKEAARKWVTDVLIK